MKNKKGFTLVELLAVIAVLGIIMSIIAVSVSVILDDSQNNIDKIQNETIKSAAKAYVMDNIHTCRKRCNVSLQDLINAGYLDNSDNLPEGSVRIVKDGDFKYFTDLKIDNEQLGDVRDFSYNGTDGTDGSVQTYTIPETGRYKLEVWGAQGGSYNESYAIGGKGGYASGYINLEKGTILYIYVGGKGIASTVTTYTSQSGGGFNGGGNAGYRGGGGGGASDIRIDANGDGQGDLYERLVIAGGGGGAYAYSSTYKANGGSAYENGSYYSETYSNFVGQCADYRTGGVGGIGSETNYNGQSGSFGIGGNTGYKYNSTSYYSNGAGGGGWYGGGAAGNYNGATNTRASGGGGGGSFINILMYSDFFAPDEYLLKDNKYYIQSPASMTTGTQTFFSPNDVIETGHSGHGYARISKE